MSAPLHRRLVESAFIQSLSFDECAQASFASDPTPNLCPFPSPPCKTFSHRSTMTSSQSLSLSLSFPLLVPGRRFQFHPYCHRGPGILASPTVRRASSAQAAASAAATALPCVAGQPCVIHPRAARLLAIPREAAGQVPHHQRQRRRQCGWVGGDFSQGMLGAYRKRVMLGAEKKAGHVGGGEKARWWCSREAVFFNFLRISELKQDKCWISIPAPACVSLRNNLTASRERAQGVHGS